MFGERRGMPRDLLNVEAQLLRGAGLRHAIDGTDAESVAPGRECFQRQLGSVWQSLLVLSALRGDWLYAGREDGLIVAQDLNLNGYIRESIR